MNYAKAVKIAVEAMQKERHVYAVDANIAKNFGSTQPAHLNALKAEIQSCYKENAMKQIVTIAVVLLLVGFVWFNYCLMMVPKTPPIPSNWREGVTHGAYISGAFKAPSPDAEAVGSAGEDGQPKRCLVTDTGVWVELMDGTYIPAVWQHPHPCYVNWFWAYVPREVGTRSDTFRLVEP